MVAVRHAAGGQFGATPGGALSLLTLLLLACNPTPPFNAVAISPIYGWVDGCNRVTITGAGFADDVSATIGGKAVTDIQFPEKETDRGYGFSAVVPAGDATGFADVAVTSAGVTDVITGSGAYYYVACPQAGYIEAVEPTEGITAGATITLSGCGLDSAGLTARFVSATDGTTVGAENVALASSCGTATATLAAPALADGAWYLQLVDATGAVVNGDICPPPDTADTAAAACTDFPLTFGGAR